MKKRTLAESEAAENELFEKPWYYRHTSARQNRRHSHRRMPVAP